LTGFFILLQNKLTTLIMKKTLLTLAVAFAFQFGIAQQTFSFETSEGFTLGNINTQNGWVTTATNEAGTTFVENQVISSEDASPNSGTNSFKLTTEGAFPGQENPVVGGFYTFTTPVARAGATFSFDFKIADDFEMEGNDYRFALTGVNNGTASVVALVQFNFTGLIRGVDNASQFVNFETGWVTGQWVNVRMELTATTVTYFVNNVQQGSYNLLTPVDITGMRMVHDNFGGFAYLDNLRVNNEPTASSETFTSKSFKHFVDANGLNFVSEYELGNVELFNTIGQSVASKNINANTGNINLNNLSSGVYIARVQATNGQSTSVKFTKN